MQNIKVVGKESKRIQIIDKPLKRIEPIELAAALGAESCGVHINSNSDLISLAEIGTKLLKKIKGDW